jgi:toxin ParE1/3/4
MLKVLQSEEARQMLADIYHYSMQRWGEKKAATYLHELLDTFSTLAQNPRIGYVHPDFPAQYRLQPVASHVVVYRFSKDTLFIVAVLHAAMDMEARIATLTETYH